ncbi:unnamed protein product, partial [Brenthis ino]
MEIELRRETRAQQWDVKKRLNTYIHDDGDDVLLTDSGHSGQSPWLETSQLRRRYYSAQVYAQTQRALSIPVTLILRWDDHSTRPVRRRTDGFTCSPRHGGETPPTSQLRAVTETYYTERLNN